jgi:hypothetical protein
VGGYDRTQARLVVGVGLALVLLNVLLTVGQPLEKSLPRSVRVAQERETFGTAKPVGSAREPVAAAAAAPSGWFGGGTRGGAASGPKSTTPLKKKAAKPSPSAKPDWSTHEHCYAQSDESEVCFYHGPLCYDGDKLIVASDHNHGQDVRTSMCYDFRHFVASPSCGYSGPHRRDNLPDDTDMQTMQDRVPRMLSYQSERKWGPMGREIHYREIGTDLFVDKEMQEAENVTFKWLDGPMYVGGLHHSWLDHTWHFSAAAMALFDLKRYNRSAHVDTGMHGAVSGSLTPVGAWEAPPMDNLLIAGDYRNVNGLSELRPWIAHLLTMLVQNHTNILWNSIWKEQWKTSKNQWLCSKQSVVIGLKPRLFNSAWQTLRQPHARLPYLPSPPLSLPTQGIGDAHVWRMLAYKYVGIKAPTKDEWPPRRITVITRIGTRNVVNIDEAVDLIRSYGLEVNWIKEMGLLTFQEQVKAMAESGILLAVHGAGLANVMFMPAHSVVIEVRGGSMIQGGWVKQIFTHPLRPAPLLPHRCALAHSLYHVCIDVP